MFNDRVEGQGESQRSKRIPLLNPTATGNGVLTQSEDGMAGVTRLHPRGEGWYSQMDFLEHGLTANGIEGIGEVE